IRSILPWQVSEHLYHLFFPHIEIHPMWILSYSNRIGGMPYRIWVAIDQKYGIFSILFTRRRDHCQRHCLYFREMYRRLNLRIINVPGRHMATFSQPEWFLIYNRLGFTYLIKNLGFFSFRSYLHLSCLASHYRKRHLPGHSHLRFGSIVLTYYRTNNEG